LPLPFRPRCSRTLFAVLLAVLLPAGARAQAIDRSVPVALDDALRAIEALSRTGVIYDRVVPLAHLERLDGGTASPVIDGATWRQAYDELRRSALASAGPDLAGIETSARAWRRIGVVPLALLDRAFDRVRPGALTDGTLRFESRRWSATGGAPLIESRAFAAAALAPRTYRGGDVEFVLPPELCFADGAGALTLDLDDGAGPRAVRVGERVRVHYRATGPRTLAVTLARTDGSRASARFRFEVAALSTPSPDDTLHVTATAPYQGQLGSGDAYVYLAAGHAALTHPILVIEGFDLDNSMNWDELYALLDQENLIETLRADGYDAVVLNFTDATVAIQQNSFVVAQLIEDVQALIAPGATIALVGASMGGLCSRYALAWLEAHGIPHRVRTWISFDAPQQGANIPLGLQYWIGFFAGQSADAATFLSELQRPAARQMLLAHLTNPPGTSGQPDLSRDTLLADLASLGNWPAFTRRVAIANGSGGAMSQGFAPAAQLIRYEYSSLFVSITGDVWALPDVVSGRVFNGSTRILFSTTSQSVTVHDTKPWDGAPGGSRASMTQLDTTAVPYGDIVALYPSHCFIPTMSSLSLSTADPFFDVATAPDPLALTPFDAIYWPAANQEHVLITPENAVWVRSEIERGVVSVPGHGPAAPGEIALAVPAPNPSSRATRLGFALPRAASVDLRVFSVDGREVRTLVREALPAGLRSATWDGRDARGARAGAGVYFARLAVDGHVLFQRLVRLD
jgi:hypothetical protein